MDDLRISYLKEKITTQSVIDLIEADLEEPERGHVMDLLDDFIPLEN
jgi:hypothetical protein